MLSALRRRLADRYSLPQWLNCAIDWIADHPNGLIGSLAARKYGQPGPLPTPVTSFDEAPIRVLVAPMNYSGQARAWALALELHNPSVSARNMAVHVPGGFDYPSDLLVPVPTYHNDADWQRRQFESIAAAATHVLIEAEEPPFGRSFRRSTAAQARALVDRGVDVAFIAHGTDIRLPSRHRELTPWSLYFDPSVYSPRLETIARRNRELLDTSGRHVFVSTPDLLADVEYATWCPVVVDLERWTPPAAIRRSGSSPLRVIHSPSVSVHKGTPLIEPVMQRLHSEGVIEYTLISGVPSDEMPAAFHGADVLLDQFRAGSYGVAACEAMAAGCIVIGHVVPSVREIVEHQTGVSLPVVESTPDTLESVLRLLADDRETVASIASASVDFVRAVHDGRRSAAILMDTWLAPGQH